MWLVLRGGGGNGQASSGTATRTPPECVCVCVEGAKGGVEWRGVSFRYRPEMPVLRQIDLRVAAGMRVASEFQCRRSKAEGACPFR